MTGFASVGEKGILGRQRPRPGGFGPAGDGTGAGSIDAAYCQPARDNPSGGKSCSSKGAPRHGSHPSRCQSRCAGRAAGTTILGKGFAWFALSHLILIKALDLQKPQSLCTSNCERPSLDWPQKAKSRSTDSTRCRKWPNTRSVIAGPTLYPPCPSRAPPAHAQWWGTAASAIQATRQPRTWGWGAGPRSPIRNRPSLMAVAVDADARRPFVPPRHRLVGPLRFRCDSDRAGAGRRSHQMPLRLRSPSARV